MYAFFKGIVAEKSADFVVLDVHDVGYFIKISNRTFDLLPTIGQEVKLYTYTAVREDDISIFGFLDQEELSFFKILINVNGVGPKAGLSILSVLSVDALRLAILSGDAKSIAKAPGIGSKTAQRIILDLKDKVSIEDTFVAQSAKEYEQTGAMDVTIKEAIEALTALGYSSSDAIKAVKGVTYNSEMTVEELLKAAFKNLI